MKSLRLGTKTVVSLIALLCLTGVCAEAVEFPDFSSIEGLNLAGSAQQAGDSLRLTPSSLGQAGAAWYEQKQSVQDGFETTFEFQITDLVGNGADGLAFVVQDYSPTAVFLGGGGIGYHEMPNSLAVEFDTYQNSATEHPVFAAESDGNHISVQTRGIDPNSAAPAYSLGSTSAIPNLSDGLVHTVKISYSSGALTVFLDDLTAPALTVTVDLATTLSLDNGAAWVGFTAATGGFYENHDILSWSYQQQPMPMAYGFDFPVGIDPDSPETSPFVSLLNGKTYTGWYVIEDGDFLAPGYDNKGTLHPGEDWNGGIEGGNPDRDKGQPVYTIGDGTVVYAADAGCGWGNVVLIQHNAPLSCPYLLPDGRRAFTVWSQYAHLDEIAPELTVGATVTWRQEIGTLGKGYKCRKDPENRNFVITRYDAHLHFEVRTPADDADPTTWPLPASYWPSSPSNNKDEQWVRLHYVNPTDFISLNQ